MKSNESSEKIFSLVVGCQKELPGDHASFEMLVRACQGAMLLYCYRMLGDFALAEDAVQEIFFKVYRQVHTLRDPHLFYPWLYRIAVNFCLNILTRSPSYETLDNDRERTASDILEKLQMESTLAKLDSEDRSLLILKYVSELSLIEIAEIYEISVGAVKMRLQRAKEEYKKIDGRRFGQIGKVA